MIKAKFYFHSIPVKPLWDKGCCRLEFTLGDKSWSCTDKMPHPADHQFWMEDRDAPSVIKVVSEWADKHNAPSWAYEK